MASTPSRRSRAKQFAEIERISLFGNTTRMGPVGLWLYAEAYSAAAGALPVPVKRYEPVPYYLACHSIELALKAYLSLHGATMIELSDSAFGHNLESVLAAAEGKSLSALVQLSAAQRAEIVKAANYYAGKVFEYPAVGEAVVAYPGLPNLALLKEVAALLVEKLAQPCKQAE